MLVCPVLYLSLITDQLIIANVLLSLLEFVQQAYLFMANKCMYVFYDGHTIEGKGEGKHRFV